MQEPTALPLTGDGAKTILLAEDEILIRAAAADAFRDAGFIVLEASSADEAESLVAAGLKPDILFTDVRMPGSRDGLMLAQALKAQLPHLLVLVASGHAALEGAAERDYVFFPKPYDIAAVLNAIGDALKQNER